MAGYWAFAGVAWARVAGSADGRYSRMSTVGPAMVRACLKMASILVSCARSCQLRCGFLRWVVTHT